MKKLLKAWHINIQHFNGGYHSVDGCKPYYAETRREARNLAYQDIRDDGLIPKDDKPLLLAIRMRRFYYYDKLLVDGQYKLVSEINYDNKVKERNEVLDKLLSENLDGKAYICKGGYYYRPNNCGYTKYRTQAGIYSLKEAIQEVKGCDLNDCMDAILIDVTEHNKAIFEEMLKLQKQMI